MVSVILPANAETFAYSARVQAAGGTLSVPAFNAVDEFITAGKVDSWWSLVTECYPFLGSTFAASLVKLKTASGLATSLANTNFVSGDYTQASGFGNATSNSDKKLNTGVIPTAQGLSATNFSMGAAMLNTIATEGSAGFASDNPASGDQRILVGGSGLGLTSLLIGSAHRGVTVRTTSYAAAAVIGYLDGVLANNSTTPATGTLDSEITLLSGTRYATVSYSPGKMGFFFVGQSLTQAQLKSITNAIQKLQLVRSPVNVGVPRGKAVFLGDSIARGQGLTATQEWPWLVGNLLGKETINVAQNSALLLIGTAPISGILRYQDVVDLLPDFVFLMYGTNDMNGDGVTDGNSTTIASYQSNLTTIANYYKTRNIKPIILSAPYNTTANDTKMNAYIVAAAAAAAAANVPLVDTLNAIRDQTTPGNFMTDANHPNAAGALVIAQRTIAAMRGIFFRELALDFASMAAAASDTKTVTIYGARAGHTVTVTSLAAPTGGILFDGYVSANDTVTVRATNITAGVVDPASAVYRVDVHIPV